MNFLLPFSLSLDSFVGGIAAAPLFRRWSDRVALALAFGVCDMAASMLGPAIELPKFISEAGKGMAIGLMLLYGIACLIVAFVTRVRLSARLAFALPLFMSLDNLVAGGADAVHGGPLMIGLASAVAALAGLVPGIWLQRFDDRKRQLVAGGAMMAAAVIVAVC